jgi:hypothetical protein
MVGHTTIVDRDPIQVMFKRVADEESAIGQGISDVEAVIGPLRGRKCYGAFADGEYRVCVQIREGDDPDAFGLEAGELPGGRYARAPPRGGRSGSGLAASPVLFPGDSKGAVVTRWSPRGAGAASRAPRALLNAAPAMANATPRGRARRSAERSTWAALIGQEGTSQVGISPLL